MTRCCILSATHLIKNNMHQGNWKCSSCAGTITELPFIPRSETGLTCRACYSSQKGGSTPKPAVATTADELPDIPFDAEPATGPQLDDGFDTAPTTPTEKPRYQGNWQCASCGGSINSLPFTPRDTSNLKCLDCFKRSKA
jgi:ribosomal protein L37AE/L43A